MDATAKIIIVTADVTDEANDKQRARPMLTHVLVHTAQVHLTMTMDAGYFSKASVVSLTALGYTPLILLDRQLHSQMVPAAPRSRPPAGPSVADRMCRILHTTHGRRLDAQRKAIGEPVFGQIKEDRGYRQFLLRGMRHVQLEWALICTTHNVLKLWTTWQRQRRYPANALGGVQKVTRKGPQ